MVSQTLFRCLLSLLALNLAGVAQAKTHIAFTIETDGTEVALVMHPEPGWHGYWKNPGDAGVANRFEWTLPPGITPGELRYPVPEKLIISGLMNHVYTGEYAMVTRLRGINDHPGVRVPFGIKGDWLACTDRICVPESGSATGEIIIGVPSLTDFGRHLRRLPQPLGSSATFERQGENMRLAAPLPASINANGAWLFAESENVVAYAAPQKTRHIGDTLIIEFKAASAGTRELASFKGLLALPGGLGLEINASRGTVPVAAEATILAALLALLGAVVGGVLLNILPCVFPIVSLKALSLARAGGDERAVQREALAYCAGAVLACLALGGALLGLRASGLAIGWAFQLQDSRVILFLLLLATAITLNLFGVFSLKGLGGGETLAGQDGTAGAFWTGALAAFVATPCTGPFMAAALGAALVLPTAAALAIFAGLGLGLALPFVALAWWPALRNRLPKPGPWMIRFQRWMALPMALTVIALGWLLWRLSGAQGLIIAGALMLVVFAAAYGIGRSRPLGIGLLSALIGIGLLAALSAPLLPRIDQRQEPASVVGAEPFTGERLQKLIQQNRRVFVYFTADWCVTCKVNERVALTNSDVTRHFAQKNIAVLVGDWTRGDPEITRFLEGQQRSGVPLYLYYAPPDPNPRVLPQLLSPAMLTGL